ncbi:hypothetical protein OC846_006863 [Tilletia horrida]|uniref:Uncharacterized protein n=1 Tax=Tilletia horrida TaxID=155126 RepID=A0AAN6GI00_9BASI|nr:hypothetical protein OC845_006880 [Tilletia horrida]KAK0542047.1 hypothetical protein OC846_006863 [Tilletia horrida]KAK0558169.1 hypothetical protein OC861_006969 [Tilletia horrida]
MARRLMRIVWPAVLGFLTLGTGIMIPFFWVVHHFIGQTVSSTQVGPLKSVVKLYYSIISSATLSISFLLGLKILFGGSPSKHQEIPGNYPAIVAVAFSILFSVGICTTTVPVYHVLAKAHSYDLQILERNGDFEAEIAMPRGDLNEVDSNTEEMTVPVLKLDENGKRPVVVLGDFKVGKTLFASFWRSGPTKTGLGRKMPTLRLPTYSSAVIVLQTVTFLTLMAVIMAPYDTFDQHNPNMAWLHPISLRDIFREDVLKRMEAVSMFFFVTLIWTFGMFPLLTFTVLISVLWQHGRAGVKAIWTEDDRVWSEGPASSAVTPESEGDEEKASSVTAEPLLVDV